MHTRTSENRAYAFAAVVHLEHKSFANCASTEKLARASNARYRNSFGLERTEVIACSPVPIGRHAAREDVVKITHSDGKTTAAIVLREAGEDE